MIQMAHLKNLWNDAKINCAYHIEVKCPFCTSSIIQGDRVWLNTMALLAPAGSCHTVALPSKLNNILDGKKISPQATTLIVAILPGVVLGLLKS